MAYIEKQLAPLLAGLLRYADTNKNMALLEETPPEHWLHRLWLKMFSNSAVTTLEFKDLLPVGSASLPDEFMVRMTGYGGQEMRSSLPFSWVIKDVLDNLLEQSKLMSKWQKSYDFYFCWGYISVHVYRLRVGSSSGDISILNKQELKINDL